tara:strand:- start:59 stop:646 length:588 start_codon:yes stop_codon:yes gene_type:complete
MKLEITQKAYKLTADMKDPCFYDDIIGYGSTRGEAINSELYRFQEGELDNYDPFKSSEPQYTDIRARRHKLSDKVLFEGKEMYRYRAEDKIWGKNRDEEAKKLMEDNPKAYAYVRAGCYGSYWGSNRCGYSNTKLHAGLYTIQEAYEIVRGSSKERDETIVITTKRAHNKSIRDEIKRRGEIHQRDIEHLKSKLQ